MKLLFFLWAQLINGFVLLLSRQKRTEIRLRKLEEKVEALQQQRLG